MNSIRSSCRTPSPLGELLLVANGDALCGVYFEGQKYFPEHALQWDESPRLPLFVEAISQLRQYFAGTRTAFDLPLMPEGTQFQRDVWKAIGETPYGQTITYAELARRCGRPSSARAAGAATGRNPLTLVIPCHRIMGSDGALTGYAGGLERKRALLTLESRSSGAGLLKVA
jgi:methylated-DNA-[protein]-cysteine S-methyltransferase